MTRRVGGRPGARRLPVTSTGIKPAAPLASVRDAGARYGRDHPLPADVPKAAWLQQLWCGFWHSPEAAPIPRRSYAEAAVAFREGYESSGQPLGLPDLVLLPTSRTVGAVITAMNEEQSLTAVLHELNRLPLTETIIVVNGSYDRTFEAARSSGAVVIHYPDPLGHDVGRSIGAKIAHADILLFVDGDFAVEAEQLAHLVFAVDSGVDVALNDLTPFVGPFRGRDNVTVVKEFLNRSLGRPDLRAASLTAVPHALSRHAIDTIGFRELMVPPKAHALAIVRGLRVEAPVSVDVVGRNRRRESNVGSLNPVERLIMGDHLEALQTVAAGRGSRLRFTDSIRRRL